MNRSYKEAANTPGRHVTRDVTARLSQKAKSEEGEALAELRFVCRTLLGRSLALPNLSPNIQTKPKTRPFGLLRSH